MWNRGLFFYAAEQEVKVKVKEKTNVMQWTMIFGFQVWSKSYAKTYLKKLQEIQNKNFKIIKDLHRGPQVLTLEIQTWKATRFEENNRF